jgi:N-acetylglutamate synthase-like GNAT family acetyltransferase
MEQPREVLGWASAEDLAAVASFYRKLGYRGGLFPADRILTARSDQKVVAAARLCREENTRVLRGMYVAPDCQGRGIGTRLLEAMALDLGREECWCVPYVHLQAFYALIGFAECRPERAPDFLRERAARYRKAGHQVIIMKRGNHGPERVW